MEYPNNYSVLLQVTAIKREKRIDLSLKVGAESQFSFPLKWQNQQHLFARSLISSEHSDLQIRASGCAGRGLEFPELQTLFSFPNLSSNNLAD
jgi:hypothetical protein